MHQQKSPKKQGYLPFKQALDNSPYFSKAFSKQFHSNQCRFCDGSATHFCFYCIDQDQMTASRALYCDTCGFSSPHNDEEGHKIISISESSEFIERTKEYISFLIEYAESNQDSFFEEKSLFPEKKLKNQKILNTMSQLKSELKTHPDCQGLWTDIKRLCDDHISISIYNTEIFNKPDVSVEERYTDDYEVSDLDGLESNFDGMLEYYQSKMEKLETYEASLEEMENFYTYTLPDLKLIQKDLDKDAIEAVEAMLLFLASSKRIGSFFLNRLPMTPANYILAQAVEVKGTD